MGTVVAGPLAIIEQCQAAITNNTHAVLVRHTMHIQRGASTRHLMSNVGIMMSGLNVENKQLGTDCCTPIAMLLFSKTKVMHHSWETKRPMYEQHLVGVFLRETKALAVSRNNEPVMP